MPSNLNALQVIKYYAILKSILGVLYMLSLVIDFCPNNCFYAEDMQMFI